jgi:hypothetical protein
VSLGAGRGMLSDTVRALKREWQRCRQSWDDQAAKRFDEHFIAPVEPAARQTMEAMERLQSAADEARRACE